MQILKTKSLITRLTITPDRVTVKIPEDTSERYSEMTVKFVEYVLEQFVVIRDEWRGVVKFDLDGLTHVSTTFKNGSGFNNRRYEVVA